MENEPSDAHGVEPEQNGCQHPLGANSEIARKLNEYYKNLLSEDVPDHLTQLLLKLEQTESAQKDG